MKFNVSIGQRIHFSSADLLINTGVTFRNITSVLISNVLNVCFLVKIKVLKNFQLFFTEMDDVTYTLDDTQRDFEFYYFYNKW